MPLLRHSIDARFSGAIIDFCALPSERTMRRPKKNVFRRVGKPTLYNRAAVADIPASLEV
jgi:hypothetical protein